MGRLKVLSELTGSIEAVATTTATQNTALGLGNETTTVFAAAGIVSEILTMGFAVAAPAGAGSGTHSATIHLGTATDQCLLFYKSAAYNVSLIITPSECASVAKLAKYDDSVGVLITYSNGTNVTQTNTRTFRMNTFNRKKVV